MKKKGSAILIALGVILCVSAITLLIYNICEDARAGKAAQSALLDLKDAIDQASSDADAVESDDETSTPQGDRVIDIAGEGYIGYLDFPTLDLTLPVMARWTPENLMQAPCRHFGTVDGCDLVIAGHNFRNHFGRLDSLLVGDAVTFTDAGGRVTLYEVGEKTQLERTDVLAAKNSEWDLLLYTCTFDGAARLAVGCRMKSSQTSEP